MSQPDQLVGTPEIARRVGVQKGTVKVWRRRHKDFPQPVSHIGNSLLFDWGAVEVWLAAPRASGRPAGSTRRNMVKLQQTNGAAGDSGRILRYDVAGTDSQKGRILEYLRKRALGDR